MQIVERCRDLPVDDVSKFRRFERTLPRPNLGMTRAVGAGLSCLHPRSSGGSSTVNQIIYLVGLVVVVLAVLAFVGLR
jgi:hypothetical protein